MATDILRPHTSIGMCRDTPTEYIDPNTRVGDNVLAPSFSKNLETFYNKATVEDQARCLELLTSLNLARAVREQGPPPPEGGVDRFNQVYVPAPPRHRPRRPKTSMAAFDREVDYRAQDVNRPMMKPYVTTYHRDFPAKTGSPGNAERPSSVRAFRASYDLSGPIGSTTYQNEYHTKKKKVPTVPIRTGSGNIRNNPHPLETFMKWKLPQRTAGEQQYSEWAPELTDDTMDRVCRGKLVSTYQQDYLGIPQGYQMKSAFDNQEDWKTRVPYTLDSSMRHSFQKPDQKPVLKGHTTRYGSNIQKNVPAHGVVPTVSNRPQMNLKTLTTYEREFLDPIPSGPRDMRDFGREMGARALLKHYQCSSGAEKEKLRRMLISMNVQPPSSRPPSSASIRSSMRFKPSVPPSGCLCSPHPGPHQSVRCDY